MAISHTANSFFTPQRYANLANNAPLNWKRVHNLWIISHSSPSFNFQPTNEIRNDWDDFEWLYSALLDIVIIRLAVNPYPWILEKKSKTRYHHRACFVEKIQSAALRHWYIFLCFGIFFRKWRSVMVPKTAFIFVKRHISPYIGICNFKLVS